MSQRIAVGILAVSIALAVSALPAEGQNSAYVRLPEFIVTDTDGLVIGAYAGASSRVVGGTSFVRVLRRDTINDENYLFFVGVDFLQGLDDDDVWYSNDDCTGNAYVLAPETLTELAGLRGSVFVVGRKVGATDEDSLILRGSGVGTDNTAQIQSRYRTSASTGPGCFSGGSTSAPALSVLAVEVDDLSDFTRSFKIE